MKNYKDLIRQMRVKNKEDYFYILYKEERDICIEALKKLTKYEELEEKEMLLKLPCKIGDTIWWFNGKLTMMESEVVGFSVDEDGVNLLYVEHQEEINKTYMYTLDVTDIGKRAFFVKEEAERVLLKRLKNEY